MELATKGLLVSGGKVRDEPRGCRIRIRDGDGAASPGPEGLLAALSPPRKSDNLAGHTYCVWYGPMSGSRFALFGLAFSSMSVAGYEEAVSEWARQVSLFD